MSSESESITTSEEENETRPVESPKMASDDEDVGLENEQEAENERDFEEQEDEEGQNEAQEAPGSSSGENSPENQAQEEPIGQHEAPDELASGHSSDEEEAAEEGGPIESPAPATNQKSDNEEEEEAEEAELAEAEERVDNEEAPVRETTAAESSTAASPEPGPTQEDLFGDADDLSTSDEEKAENNRKRLDSFASQDGDDQAKSGGEKGAEFDARSSANQETEGAELGGAGGGGVRRGDQSDEEEEVAETLIDVEIPKITADLGNQLHFVKFPNFLSVEPRPFDLETYEDEIDDDDVLDEEGRSRVKLKVENTIRWRQSLDEQGNPVRSSNAKIVRWSDGSMSLYLGSEVFDVHTHPLQGDHHHLFIRQGTGLQGRAIFRTKLTFRPHSTESFTHRKMTMSMADRTNKTQKVKVLPAVGKDPEAQKQELLKKEEERLRASARRESQQRRNRDKAHGRGLSASYLEPDRLDSDDDNNVSISAIKRSFKAGGKDFAAARAIYASDEESVAGGGAGAESLSTGIGESSRVGGAEKKLERAKRLDSDDEGAESAGDERRKRRANVIEDDDDE